MRDDGGVDPLLDDSAPLPADAESAESAQGGAAEVDTEELALARVRALRSARRDGEHPMRARLRERALAVRAPAEPEPPAARAARDAALEQLVSGPPPSTGSARDRLLPTLPPRRFAGLLSGVLVAVTFAALAVVLQQVAPREPFSATAPSGSAPSGGFMLPWLTPQAPEQRPAMRTGPTAAPVRATAAAGSSRPKPWRVRDGASTGKLVEGVVGRKAFLSAVQDAGVSKDQTYRVYQALKELKNLDRCGRTDRFEVLLDAKGQTVLGFEYIVGKEEIYQLREGTDGKLAASKLDMQIEHVQVRGALALGSAGLSDAAQAAGFHRELAGVLAEALEGHLSVEELGPGDRLRVIAQEVTALGEFSRYSGVEAVEVIRARQGAEPVRVYFYRGGAWKGYFDAKGRQYYDGGWARPIPGAPVTSHFNPKRLHPVLKVVRPHNGTDFGAPTGTPIGSARAGEVFFLGFTAAGGNTVGVRHADGYESWYLHMVRFAEGLEQGDKVGRGQLVGYVGSTGRSTGPHLHFGIKKDGKWIDPLSLKLGATRVLADDQRGDFEATRARYDALLEQIALPAPVAPTPSGPTPGEDLDLGDATEGLDAAAASARAAAPVGGPAAPEAAPGVPEPAVPEPAAPFPAGPAPAAAAPPPGGASMLYLSDEELLKLQTRTHSGEVSP